MDTGLALVNHAQLPPSFWCYAFSAATFTCNRTIPMDSTDRSAYEIFYEESPNLRDLRVFGCLVYPNIHPSNRFKFQKRYCPHIFLGYLDKINGYLCYNPNNNKLTILHDIIFIEDDFSMSQHLKSKDHPSEDLIGSIKSPNSIPIRLVNRFSTANDDSGEPNSLSSCNLNSGSPNNDLATTESYSRPVDQPLQRHTMIIRAQAGIRRPNLKYTLQISA